MSLAPIKFTSEGISAVEWKFVQKGDSGVWLVASKGENSSLSGDDAGKKVTGLKVATKRILFHYGYILAFECRKTKQIGKYRDDVRLTSG